MRKLLLSLRFGNKGFIFSLDAVMAVIIATAILFAATFFITKAGDESASKLQTLRIGSDALALLDYGGTLDTLSVESIEVELNRMLPINHHMRIRVECSGQQPIIVETTDEYPANRFIGAGKRVFVTNTSRYCIANYDVWLK